jgi:general stress protein 26
MLMKYLSFFLIIILLASCNICDKKSTLGITKEIMKNAKNCALITVDSEGVAHVRTMDPFLPEEDLTVWMGTNSKSLKVQQIKNNNKVSLYYFDAKTVSYVTLQGIAEIVDSQETKKKYFKEEWKNFYKNRTTAYNLIKFTPKFGTIISEKYNILGDSITWKAPHLKF